MTKINCVLYFFVCCLLCKVNSDEIVSAVNTNEIVSADNTNDVGKVDPINKLLTHSDSKLLDMLNKLSEKSVDQFKNENQNFHIYDNSDIFKNFNFNTPPPINTKFLDSTYLEPIEIKEFPKIDYKELPKIDMKDITLGFEPSDQERKRNRLFAQSTLIHGAIFATSMMILAVVSMIGIARKNRNKNKASGGGNPEVALTDESNSNTYKILFPGSNNKYERM